MKVRDRIHIITDLMLGALYADATMTGDEDRAVRELLGKLLLCPADKLPDHVVARIKNFSLLEFDIEVAARDFLSDPPMKKRRLLELIAALQDRDGTDFSEDEYLRDLAECLGMQTAEYQDLVLNYEIEQLRQSFESIRMTDIEAAVAANPDDNLPRWRRTALGQKEAKSTAEAGSDAIRDAVTPPPIPDAARRENK